MARKFYFTQTCYCRRLSWTGPVYPMTRNRAIFLLCCLAARGLALSTDACLRNAVRNAPYQRRFIIIILWLVPESDAPQRISLPRLTGRLIHNIRVSKLGPLLLVLESLNFLIEVRVYSLH